MVIDVIYEFLPSKERSSGFLLDADGHSSQCVSVSRCAVHEGEDFT